MSEPMILQNTIASGIVAAIICAFAYGTWRALMPLYTWLRRNDQGYPLEESIEAALLPHLHAAIYTVHKFTIESLRAGAEITEAQKRAAFAELYRVMVPEKWRLIVDIEMWNVWGSTIYDTMRNSSNAVIDRLEEEFMDWRGENEEPGA